MARHDPGREAVIGRSHDRVRRQREDVRPVVDVGGDHPAGKLRQSGIAFGLEAGVAFLAVEAVVVRPKTRGVRDGDGAQRQHRRRQQHADRDAGAERLKPQQAAQMQREDRDKRHRQPDRV